MGYEIAVTPLQLAAAYATFANGGELVEPSLVKEIVAPDGIGAVQASAARRAASRCRSPSPTRCGTCCSMSSTRERRFRRRSTTICLPARRERRAHGARTLRRRALQPELRRPVSRRQSAVRHRREADGAAELDLCRQYGRTGDQGHSAGGDRRARRRARSLAARVERGARPKAGFGEAARRFSRRAQPRQVAASPTRDDSSRRERKRSVRRHAAAQAGAAQCRASRAPFRTCADSTSATRCVRCTVRASACSWHGRAGPPATSPAAGELAATGTLIRLHFDY